MNPKPRPAGRISRRLTTFATGIGREIRAARMLASDRSSVIKLVKDLLLFRVLRVWPGLESCSRPRTVRLDGAELTYRLNRGDIQSIREVWFQGTYRVPFGRSPRVVLDLGANIGVSSVWFAHVYGCRVVGVEPDPLNAALARRNYEANGILGEVDESAVGPRNGRASFTLSKASNLGSLSEREGAGTIEVNIRTPQSLMAQVGLDHVDLCKLDIEGGEADLLLDGDTSWLASVGGMLAELHHAVIDGERVIGAIERAGMRFYPAGIDGRLADYFTADLHHPPR